MTELTTELATLSVPDGRLTTALSSGEKRQLEQKTLPEFLARQRWFGAKDSAIKDVALLPLGELEPGRHALAVADVGLSAETQRYFLPLSAVWAEEATMRASSATPVLARLSAEGRSGTLVDSALDRHLAEALMQAMHEGRRLVSSTGEVVFEGAEGLDPPDVLGEPRPLGAEQSNVSIAFSNKAILKLYRRLRSGEQPDVEVSRFLTEVGHFANTPPYLGQIRHLPAHGEATTLAAAFAFVPNQGDAWGVVTEALYQDLQKHGSAAGSEAGEGNFEPSLLVGEKLGQRTAQLHKALAVETDQPGFAVETLSKADVLVWSSEAIVEANTLLTQLQQSASRLPQQARSLSQDILENRDMLIERMAAASGLKPSGGRSRIHGDYHLGQVLAAGDDFMIIDFEGEPRRSLEERRAKSSPLRDVAGMLRSFHYAASSALIRYKTQGGSGDVSARAEAWRQRVSADFLKAYQTHVAGIASYPADPTFATALLDMFLLQKAVYEVGYELANRPDWIQIPLSGVWDLLNKDQGT